MLHLMSGRQSNNYNCKITEKFSKKIVNRIYDFSSVLELSYSFH
jgi:hypothetical protein